MMAKSKNKTQDKTIAKPDKKKNQKSKSSWTITPFWRYESVQFVTGVILVFMGIFIFISLVSFFFTGEIDQSKVENSPLNQLFSQKNNIQNWAGTAGACIANTFINKWIGLSSFIFTLWLSIVGLRLMRVTEANMWRTSVLCALSCIILSLSFGFAHIVTGIDSFISWGGNHGCIVAQFLYNAMGSWGTALIILTALLILLIMISQSTIEFIRTALRSNPFKNPFKKKSNEEKAEIQENNNSNDSGNDSDINDNNNSDKEESQDTDFIFIKNDSDNKDNDDSNVHTETTNDEIIVPIDNILPNEEKDDNNNNADLNDIGTDVIEEPIFTIATGVKDEIVKEALGEYDPTLDLSFYKKPSLDLLKAYPGSNKTVDMSELEMNKQRIIETLATFKIKINSIEAIVGPTVTLYKIVPGESVRIAQIKRLEDDIALSLSALGVRIIAPIPGEGKVGIEVPNSDPQIVSMHSIIASRKFQESKYELPIALGKTITNDVYVADLTKMPHVLVAGATGQGKSVGLNAIITSLLYKKHPSELKLVLIDPKKVEFSIYSDVECHFLAKLSDCEEAIITDTTKVVHTLQSITHEMDMRYDLLRTAHVRNIKEYNDKFKSRHLSPDKGHRFLPYIVVIIDEFSDLIMTAGKEVEAPIIRIAQLARAVGIHLIIATQRPSTNVITGIIKANFPARIAFRVQSMVDSRTILDCPGANQLIGRGDMLISQSGRMERVQCAFVDTPEVESICEYIGKQQGYPHAFYLPEYVGDDSDNSGDGIAFDTKDRDPLFEDAARFIVSSQQTAPPALRGKASTSKLQSRYSIGYNRAGRLMDQLEAAGIVGPTVGGGKPREVLILDMEQLENKLMLLR